MSKILSYKVEDVEFVLYPEEYKAFVRLNNSKQIYATFGHHLMCAPDTKPTKVVLNSVDPCRIRLLEILNFHVKQMNRETIENTTYTKEDLFMLKAMLFDTWISSETYEHIVKKFDEFIAMKENE